MKILVTGARGFLGRHIVTSLVARGHVVEGLEQRDASGHRHRVDLRDSVATKKCFETLRPELIIHAAGRLPHTASAGELFEVHSIGTIHLLSAAHATKVRRFVSIGSASEYGLRHEPVPLAETDTSRPSSAYGRSKLLQTLTVQYWLDTWGLSGATLRVFNLFGADQVTGSVLPDLITRLREATKTGQHFIRLPRPGDVRDYLPVEVAADLIAELALRDDCNGVCNVCSGRPTTMREVATWACQAWDWPGEVQWGERTDAEGSSSRQSPPAPSGGESEQQSVGEHCSVGDVTRLSNWLGRKWSYDCRPEMQRIVREARDKS